MSTALADTLQHTLGPQFRVERELGGGGMSRVFLAHDLSLDRDVVVKVLSEQATEGVSADRFRREIQLIARLQHPHVVPILSAGAADGSLYYMMPFVAGETLRARLAREGTLPIADVVRLLREVLDALAFAHDHGVVHRDVKPENVLLASGHAVVADFGIAKALRESGTLTSAGFALGTPTYMAPEQATADPTTDHRADLYAVGVLGYELLTGAAPFTGTAQQVITQHLTTPAAPIASRRADVPDALADTIARALAKDPAERPQSAREMIAALDAMTTPAAAPSRGAVAHASDARTDGRARRLGVTLAAAAVLVVAAIGLLAVRTRTRTMTAAPVAEGADLIAVMPLSAVSDTSLARLGQDLVVTLSANLDGVGSLHTVDAATLLMRARRLPSPLPLADARAAARELGARSVLTGTLINDGRNVRATVALHRVGSDSAIANATAVAAPRDIAALTDSLTWSVLRQVWQRGTPPSPVLTGLTTKSIDALRAFLDAERQFQRLNSVAALAGFRRAFELDSNFAQAYLRYDFVNTWSLLPSDEATHARLIALKDRLPERDRLWVETSGLRLPFLEYVARWKELEARYPEYPPVLMSAADPILHTGPLFGIPITDARPYLDRLERLVPDHGDTRFHRALLDMARGTFDSTAASLRNASRTMGAPWGSIEAWLSALYAHEANGAPLPPADSVLALGRLIAAQSRESPVWLSLSGLLGIESPNAGPRLDALERIRAAGIYSGDLARASTFGEGLMRASRGDWAGAMRALRQTESSPLGFTARVTSARVGVLGAWLGAFGAATADSAFTRVRSLPIDDATPLDRVELRWLDGMVGVLDGDEARMQRARHELQADTATPARRAARSLSGHWLARANPAAGADTLRAVSDDAMRGRSRDILVSVEALDRLVIARALRKAGAPAQAERYLMWTDAALNADAGMSVRIAISPLVHYERALAYEEAGDDAAAAYRLRRFLVAYDRPPAAHRALVDDARRRLARLERTDAPAPRAVAPR